MECTQGKLISYAGKRKHHEARFIVALKADGTREFIAKVYGHNGQPVQENSAKLVQGWMNIDKQNECDSQVCDCNKFHNALVQIYSYVENLDHTMGPDTEIHHSVLTNLRTVLGL